MELEVLFFVIGAVCAGISALNLRDVYAARLLAAAVAFIAVGLAVAAS